MLGLLAYAYCAGERSSRRWFPAAGNSTAHPHRPELPQSQHQRFGSESDAPSVRARRAFRFSLIGRRWGHRWPAIEAGFRPARTGGATASRDLRPPMHVEYRVIIFLVAPLNRSLCAAAQTRSLGWPGRDWVCTSRGPVGRRASWLGPPTGRCGQIGAYVSGGSRERVHVLWGFGGVDLWMSLRVSGRSCDRGGPARLRILGRTGSAGCCVTGSPKGSMLSWPGLSRGLGFARRPGRGAGSSWCSLGCWSVVACRIAGCESASACPSRLFSNAVPSLCARAGK